jgi:hypothetical protein
MVYLLQYIYTLNQLFIDDNETEIVEQGGLEPIVQCAAMAADAMDPGAKAGGSVSARELENLEELGAQCARSLRNLSVNRKNSVCKVVGCDNSVIPACSQE